MRLFIAIDFNELSVYFNSLQKKLSILHAKLSLTKAFHLTLKFFGEVSINRVEEINNRLRELKFNELEVSTGALEFFPDRRHIRVIWVAIKPEESIVGLSKSVDACLHNIFKPEKKFKPHITLARVKIINDVETFVKSVEDIKTEEKSIKISNIYLYKSTLSPRGAVHEILGKYPL